MLQITKILNLNETTGLHLVKNKDFSFLDANLGVFIISFGDCINVIASDDYYKILKDITGSLDIEDIFEASFISLLDGLVSKDNYLLTGPYLVFTPKGIAKIQNKDDYTIQKSANSINELERHSCFENAIDVNINKEFYLYLLKKESKVIAVCSASREVDSIYSIGIEVSEQYRNKELGSYLLKHIANDLISNNIIPIYLTKISNINSIKLANSSGFKSFATTLYTI